MMTILALDLSLSEKRAFWGRINQGTPDECWEWLGARNDQGYGNLKVGGKTVRAHRVAYTLANDSIPPGLYVCHRCDNPPCCNPDHLFVGSARDNNRDKAAKGRARGGPRPARFAPRGENHPQAILSESDVRSIRYRHGVGESQSALARSYGVSISTVHLIVHRKKWAHVK